MSQLGDMPGSSLRNTSGYSFTMGTCSGLLTFRMWRVGSGRLDCMWQVMVFPRWLVIVMVLSVHVIVPRCLVNQCILRIMSILWELSTTRLVGNTTPLRLIEMLIPPSGMGCGL
jgi:hypothetical protein